MIVKKSVEADYPPLMCRQRDALDEYAKAHGPNWKDCLRAEWADATAEPSLHHLRTTHGTYWLRRFEVR